MTYSTETAQLRQLIDTQGTWNGIDAESAARMRLQNRFRSGLDIARYTAKIMRADMAAYATAVRSGAETGATGKPFKAIVHIGIGGSDLGPRVVWDGLRPVDPQIDLRFVANIDPRDMAEALTGPRAALIGDAAHAVHPVAGQGLNMGLKDAAALAEVLADAVRLGEDIGSDGGLDRYARWRRFDNAALAAGFDAFVRLFSNDLAPVRLARDLGMAAVNRIGPLRRAFMQEAGGATGDLPRLLRGEVV